MLDVLAMESARAGAIVVGEDLGTVEEGFRHDLSDTRVLSTRLVWFEDVPPEEYPREALAMVTTHDLPTIAGVSSGADDDELIDLDRPAADEASARLKARLAAPVEDTAAVPADLAASPHDRLGRHQAHLERQTVVEGKVGAGRGSHGGGR